MIFFRELPGLAATNLTGIVAFGIFVFKAGVRAVGTALLLSDVRDISRLLAFAPLARRLAGRRRRRRHRSRGGTRAADQGRDAAVRWIFLAVYLWALARRLTHARNAGERTYADARSRLAVAIVFAAAFFIVLWPYLVDQQAGLRPLLLQREQHVLCLVRRLGARERRSPTRTVTASAGRPWPNRSCRVPAVICANILPVRSPRASPAASGHGDQVGADV